MREIKINDGTKEYVLKNEFGKEICKLHFRPTDLSLYSRLKTTAVKIAEVVKPLADIDIGSDGSANDDSGYDVLNKAADGVSALFNELFDTDDASEVFKHMNPFSAVEGQFFCEVVIGVITDIVSEEMNKEAKASQKRVSKYLEG